MSEPELRIVHLDEALAVVDKPAGLVVHPAPSHTGPTLVSELAEILGGGDPERPGIREWLEGLGRTHVGARLVTFDTRVAKVRHLPGSAAKSAARTARRHGLTLATSSESFYVDDVQGPLLSGELVRALAWGAGLGSVLGAPTP